MLYTSYLTFKLKKEETIKLEAGKMGQQLKPFIALLEIQSSVPITHISRFITTLTLASVIQQWLLVSAGEYCTHLLHKTGNLY